MVDATTGKIEGMKKIDRKKAFPTVTIFKRAASSRERRIVTGTEIAT